MFTNRMNAILFSMTFMIGNYRLFYSSEQETIAFYQGIYHAKYGSRQYLLDFNSNKFFIPFHIEAFRGIKHNIAIKLIETRNWDRLKKIILLK